MTEETGFPPDPEPPLPQRKRGEALEQIMADAPGPTSTKGIQVTCTDLDTGESETHVIWDDYVLVCAGSCYQHHIAAYANGTRVITVKGRRGL